MNTTFKFKSVSRKDCEVFETMNKQFDKYIEYVKNKSFNPHFDIIKEDFYKVLNSINQIFLAYYDGEFLEAYRKMDELIKNIEKYLLILDTSSPEFTTKYFFRGRIGKYNDEFTKEDIFHIPFKKRYLADTGRFSIHGLPCLYLGESLYIIWEENRKPDINTLFASIFKLKNKEKNLRILDLTSNIEEKYCKCKEFCSYSEQLSEVNNTYENICTIHSECIKYKQIITGLFRIACSIKVQDEGSRKFKSEYIIPQILLSTTSSLSNQKDRTVDGIKYLSVDIADDSNSKIFYNYAFPTKMHNHSVYGLSAKKISRFFDNCDYSLGLVKYFDFSKPINLGIQQLDIVDTNSYIDHLFTENITLNGINKVNYKNTIFFKLEQKLINSKYISTDCLINKFDDKDSLSFYEEKDRSILLIKNKEDSIGEILVENYNNLKGEYDFKDKYSNILEETCLYYKYHLLIRYEIYYNQDQKKAKIYLNYKNEYIKNNETPKIKEFVQSGDVVFYTMKSEGYAIWSSDVDANSKYEISIENKCKYKFNIPMDTLTIY